jgi:threonyl-tRNA synthetase
MKLSTMPDNHLGDVSTWERAEAQLTKALDEFKASTGTQWELNPGDGAFYGPKIDITISDALRREFQCATIQLDFQLPQQFNLEYRTEEAAAAGTKPVELLQKDDKPAEDMSAEKPAEKAADGETKTDEKLVIRSAPPAEADSSAVKKEEGHYRRELTPGCARPVMIHRAIYGSFERFIGILTEHFGGKWPFWLSPRQILIVPVMASANDYCEELQKEFRSHHFHADIDISGNTMQKKIRTGQLAQYNLIMVVGAQEKDSRSVNIRNRDIPETQKMGELVPVDQAIELMKSLRDERRLNSALKKE